MEAWRAWLRGPEAALMEAPCLTPTDIYIYIGGDEANDLMKGEKKNKDLQGDIKVREGLVDRPGKLLDVLGLRPITCQDINNTRRKILDT